MNRVGLEDRDYLRDEYDQERRGFSMPSPQSVTVALIIINVALYLFNFFSITKAHPDGWLNDLLSISNLTVMRPWLWFQFLTYGFAHASPGHIFFNMLALWFLGRSVEEMIGQREYLRFYLIAMVLGSIIWAIGLVIFNRDAVFHSIPGRPSDVLFGASGAISAVVMLFILRNPHATLVMFPIPIPIKAWVVGVMMIVGNISLSFQPAQDASISRGAST